MVKKADNAETNKVPLLDQKGKKVETIELDKDVFNGKFSEPLLYQAIVMYQASKRQGTASTKTRSEVRGGGKKPWRQKGTGRARAGSIRSPLWRGGGIVFGPHPRDFRYSLPKKMRRKAFISSINAKLKSGEVLGVENITVDEPKTKKIQSLLRALKINNKVLILVDKIDRNLYLATRNMKNVTLKKANEATALDVLSSERLLLSRPALEVLGKIAKP